LADGIVHSTATKTANKQQTNSKQNSKQTANKQQTKQQPNSKQTANKPANRATAGRKHCDHVAAMAGWDCVRLTSPSTQWCTRQPGWLGLRGPLSQR
jgi:hypothetical protein